VFFGNESPSLITPFADWPNATEFAAPAWWQAYTALKHDRFSNQSQGTLEHAVNSVAALLLAIVYSGQCDLAIVTASLLDTGDYNPWAYSDLIRDIPNEIHPKVETKLFAHPVGVFGKECTLSHDWRGNSVRFNAWWALNSKKFTTVKSTSS